jgi:hypothetical protein
MAENINEWPRVHTCLYDWCPEKRDDCERCDAVVAILRKIPEKSAKPPALGQHGGKS